MARLICTVIFIMFAISSPSYSGESSHKYIDLPFFNILPNDSVDKISKRFGDTTSINASHSHYCVLYYDYRQNIGLIFYIRELDKTIWGITFVKEIKLQTIYNFISQWTKNVQIANPRDLQLPKVLTKKGLKIGMTQQEVEAILKTKLPIYRDEAYLVRDGCRMDFIFSDGKLIKLSWYAVDLVF